MHPQTTLPLRHTPYLKIASHLASLPFPFTLPTSSSSLSLPPPLADRGLETRTLMTPGKGTWKVGQTRRKQSNQDWHWETKECHLSFTPPFLPRVIYLFTFAFFFFFAFRIYLVDFLKLHMFFFFFMLYYRQGRLDSTYHWIDFARARDVIFSFFYFTLFVYCISFKLLICIVVFSIRVMYMLLDLNQYIILKGHCTDPFNPITLLSFCCHQRFLKEGERKLFFIFSVYDNEETVTPKLMMRPSRYLLFSL